MREEISIKDLSFDILKDLRFPLADLRYTARSEFTKQKLLIGKFILRGKITDINNIDSPIGYFHIKIWISF